MPLPHRLLETPVERSLAHGKMGGQLGQAKFPGQGRFHPLPSLGHQPAGVSVFTEQRRIGGLRNSTSVGDRVRQVQPAA